MELQHLLASPNAGWSRFHPIPHKNGHFQYNVQSHAPESVITPPGGWIRFRPGVLSFLKALPEVGIEPYVYSQASREWTTAVAGALTEAAGEALFREVYSQPDLVGGYKALDLVPGLVVERSVHLDVSRGRSRPGYHQIMIPPYFGGVDENGENDAFGGNPGEGVDIEEHHQPAEDAEVLPAALELLKGLADTLESPEVNVIGPDVRRVSVTDAVIAEGLYDALLRRFNAPQHHVPRII